MTVIPRKFIASIFTVLAIIVVMAAVIWGSSSATTEQTIQNSREISRSFALAFGFVDHFKNIHGRIPYENEFLEWAKTQPDSAHSAKHMTIVISQYELPREVIEKFGSPPINSYIIEYWRGEWSEYYVSWVNASTLEFDAKKFYFLGSALIDGLALFVLSVLFGVIAYYIWPCAQEKEE